MGLDGYQRILIPTDFSDISAAVLQRARRLADTFASSLHILHVVEDPIMGMGLEESYVMPNEFVQRVEQQSRELLERALTPGDRQNYQAELAIREGSPFVEIVRYARDQQIELIVMGTHGRSAVSHMLVGSVVRQVLRHAPCPVLVIPSSGESVTLP